MWPVCHRSEVHALRGYPTAGLTAWLLMPVQHDLLYACHMTLDTPVKGSRSISSTKSPVQSDASVKLSLHMAHDVKLLHICSMGRLPFNGQGYPHCWKKTFFKTNCMRL